MFIKRDHNVCTGMYTTQCWYGYYGSHPSIVDCVTVTGLDQVCQIANIGVLFYNASAKFILGNDSVDENNAFFTAKKIVVLEMI